MSKPVVLITRALTGIGRANALALAKAGTQVLVHTAAEKRRLMLSSLRHLVHARFA